MIPFFRPCYTSNEDQYVSAALRSKTMSGDSNFGIRCQGWFEQKLGCARALLTPSCTHALEMAALLLDIGPGDEVIMPSYTFTSTANAFVLRGAEVVFVDIRPETMNIDERLIEAAITSRTRAIVPVHYAGVGCDMDEILSIARRHQIVVIEDAAQGIMSTYNGRHLGTLGDLSAYSFHHSKNLTSGGEGGLLIVNDPRYISRAEVIREKGTNRSAFFRGEVDKYTWVDVGSSYLPSEIQAAYLWGQLERAEHITNDRRAIWDRYFHGLADVAARGLIELSSVPPGRRHNGHMFYLKTRSPDERSALLGYLKEDSIHATFHYIPLHSAPAGSRYSRFHGIDAFTTRESERIVRLPLWYGMDADTIDRVIGRVKSFYK